jgi:16S rRNA (cytosine967-C5)-methyltransferase
VFNYRVVPWDGSERRPTKTKFDGVLVDAPCAGLGTWQRNPHARWTTTATDVTELSEVQTRLLRHVAPAVKPGGRLIYAVCTLSRAETLGVVTRFAETAPEFEPLALTDPFQPASTPRTPQWVWPQERGGNGMFVAAWRRKD